MTTRINNLDHLRGLTAIIIMIYHYFSWTFKHYDSDSLLGILGVYGVSIFYILSGITLYFVYNSNLKSIYKFFLKRIFRIYPLLWLTILLSIIVLHLDFNNYKLILNFSGLFGFIAPEEYMVTGSWSIGNELVFYTFFPFIIIINSKWKYFIETSFLVSLIVAIYFAFYKFDSTIILSTQWTTYINPFNQIFLFIGGILIGKTVRQNKNNSIGIAILLLITLFSFFNPLEGDKINIVSGFNRFIFSGFAFAITIAFLVINYKLPKNIDAIFSKLGHISYSLYLMHPIIFWLTNKYINRTNDPISFLIVAMSASIVISLLTYYFYELKFIKLGKHLVKK